MIVDEKRARPIWLDTDERTVCVIDQRQLPHELVVQRLHDVDGVIWAIKEMLVRGAPLIGVTAAYGVYLAVCHLSQDLSAACARMSSIYWCTPG